MILNAQDVDVIADHTSPNQQGWTREVTVKTGLDGSGHKVRVTIYRDSYDFQSRIKVEVWSPTALQWNVIRTLAGKDHGNLPGAYTLTRPESRDSGKREIFTATAGLVDELIGYAQEVLA